MWTKNSRPIFVFLFAATCALSISGCATHPLITATKPTVIGVVSNTTGYPEVLRNNQTYMLAAQSRIYADDVIVTDQASKVLLTMGDGTTFLLGAETHFVLHRYNMAEDLGADITLTSGSVKTKMTTGPVNATRSIEIRTPMAVITAIDAEFWSGFTFGDNTLDIALIHGLQMTVSNSHGQTELTAQTWGTSVIGDSAPQPAKAWSNQKMNRALSSTDL